MVVAMRFVVALSVMLVAVTLGTLFMSSVAMAQVGLPPNAQRLLDAITRFKGEGKTPEQLADAGANLADQLRDIDVPKSIIDLDKVVPATTADDLAKLGDLLGAIQRGDFWRELNDAYNELSKRYAAPNLPQAEKDKIYGQLKKLYDLLSGKDTLINKLNKLKDDVINKLKKAGLEAAAKAFDDLIHGKDPTGALKDKLKETLKGFDPNKLKDLFKNPFGGGSSSSGGIPSSSGSSTSGGSGTSTGSGGSSSSGAGGTSTSSGSGGSTGSGGSGSSGAQSYNGPPINIGGDCKKLLTTKAHDVARVSREEVLSCVARGYDAPWQLRVNMSGMAPTNQFSKFQTFRCDASGVCKNSSGSRTALSQLPSGYQPQNNPNLTVPEIPWKDVKKTPLPCGAVGGLSEIALQTLWGNVHLNMPPQAKTLINNSLKQLLGKLFGKKNDCQDGALWGNLNNLLNLILPALGLKGPSFVFDRTNNTFLAPPNTLLGLPTRTTFLIDLSAGGANFNLPVGGSFFDANGNKVVVSHNASVQFNSDGTATTSDGGVYKVQADGLVTLDPHGVVAVPPNTIIPVPPETMLFPMGPITKPPAWAAK